MEQSAEIFSRLGLQVFERGWLSSNNVLFAARGNDGATVVDTGYAAHAAQTLALIDNALGTRPLERIVNTHLHSDHCGGNAALQARWQVETFVPANCFYPVVTWDQARLSFQATDQRCDRFVADVALRVEETLHLAGRAWQVHASPGHDPTAVMLFEPEERVLISADALWERRLAIVFPELVGLAGFSDCMETLSLIERLSPAVVIPGHGRPFTGVSLAVQASRERIEAFVAAPDKHHRYAMRSLAMFHMFDAGARTREHLIKWMRRTPISSHLDESEAVDIVDSLIRDRLVVQQECKLVPA